MIDYTAHLRADGERMAAAVARDLEAHVPTCPAWNVAKLTIHTGQHHRWVADAVRKGGEPPEDPPKPGLRDDALVEWFRDGWRDLADLLDGAGDEAPAWTWSGDNRVGFWRRRTALETLVHRWDAENATGGTSPLDAELSADGIDEMLFVMVAGSDSVYSGARASLTLTTDDAPGAWTVDLEDGAPPRPRRGAGGGGEDGASAPAVAISGTAENLLLYLWGRLGVEAVSASGDEAALAGVLAWVSE